jgi:hypothetical protein
MAFISALCVSDFESKSIPSHPDIQNFFPFLHLTGENDPLSGENDPLGEENDPLGEENDPLGEENDPLSEELLFSYSIIQFESVNQIV